MNVRHLVAGVLTAAVMLVGVGCGPAKNKPVKVAGRVALDGKPVSGAAVQFVPEEGGTPAHAKTEEDGSFRLTTYNEGDRALPGNYKVLVSWEEPPPPMFRGGESGPSRQEMQKALDEHREKMKKLKPSPIPAVYNDLAKTPLRQAVPAKGKVEIRLDSKAE